jgi:hypothetical protein
MLIPLSGKALRYLTLAAPIWHKRARNKTPKQEPRLGSRVDKGRLVVLYLIAEAMWKQAGCKTVVRE